MLYSEFKSQQMLPLALTRQTQNYNRTKALKLNVINETCLNKGTDSHTTGFDCEDGGSTFLRNLRKPKTGLLNHNETLKPAIRLLAI
jgi:hypothetical protein